MFLRSFETKCDKVYLLTHNVNDDSRYVRDEDENIVLTIDRDLNIWNNRLGIKSGYIRSFKGEWRLFRPGYSPETLDAVGLKEWNSLEHAECLAAALLLEP